MQQAVCVRRKKNERKSRKNPTAPKTHHEIHSSPATATTSRRHATKHVPNVSPYSPAYPGCVEIILVHLSQSVKTTSVIPMTMETRCSKFIFPNYAYTKKKAEYTVVPPVWGTRGKMLVFLGLFVHAAVCGGTCDFMLKIVNTLIKNSSRDDKPSIST